MSGHVLVIGVDGVRFDLLGEETKEVSLEAWDAADQAATELTAGILAGDAPRLSFVYLGAVDIYGHVTGSGRRYRAQALAADTRVGQLLAAVRSRPGYDRKGWTIVAVTDHGQLDRGGHGGREPEVATAWVAAAGPGIRPGDPAPVTRQVDVAPLVLAALGDRRELAAVTHGRRVTRRTTRGSTRTRRPW